jgi:hypothetical protein
MEGQPESALVMILANPKVSPIYRGLFKHPSGIQIAAHSRAFDTHGMSTLSRAELADDFNAIIQDIVGDINAIIFRTSASLIAHGACGSTRYRCPRSSANILTQSILSCF